MERQGKTERALKACMAYWRLSKLLFSGGKKSILNIWELPEDSEFYRDATDIAAEIGADWKHMSVEESNAIIMSLLETVFLRMKVSSDVSVVINVKVDGKSTEGHGNPKGKGSPKGKHDLRGPG